MATSKTYGKNEQLPASVAGPIQQSISQIQSGINSLNSGGGSSGGVGAVNAQGQIVDSSGRVTGVANPADRYSSSARQATQVPEVGPTQPIEDPSTQLSPTSQVPQGLANQANQIQQGINQLSSQKGLKLQQTPTGSYTAVPDLIQQQRQAFETANQLGIQAPQSAGAGSAMVRATTQGLTPPSESPSMLSPAEDLDPRISDYLVDYDDFRSPENQHKSLMEEYQAMSKSLGLDTLNEKLVNAEAIINGTEDDIRLEVEKAGGTITASQLVTFGNARNKTLIQNYNKLLATKSAITTQLSTLMELSVQDRRFAEAEFDRKLDYAFKIADYKQKAVNNTKENYRWMIESGGGANILLDPRATASAERSLGLPTGGLSNIINRQAESQALALQKSRLENQNLQSQINERNAKTTTDGQPSPFRAEREARISTSIDDLYGRVNNKTVSFGSLTKYVPGTAAANFSADLDTLKANIAFSELQAMREASKTGGALGNVANQELELLQSTLGALNQRQSPENFKKNLNKIKESLGRWDSVKGGNVVQEGSDTIIITD